MTEVLLLILVFVSSPCPPFAVPAASGTAGPGCAERSGTAWPAATAESEPGAAAAPPPPRLPAPSRSGTPGSTWWR